MSRVPGDEMTKLRVLCLHGYHGSGEVLRGQLRGWAREVAELAELVCVDAPSIADGDFGWWHARADVPAPGAPPVKRYRGWSRTRAWIARYVAEHGPFDGVLGFSQGAALAALLVALAVVEPAPLLRFAIMIGGFQSADARHAPWFAAGPLAVPSLHVIGRADSIVSPAASHALAARFAAPVVVEHDGGHVIADTPAVRTASRAFLTHMARRPAPRHARVADGATPARSPSAPIEIPLWPGRAHPVMRIYLPDAAAGPLPAMVVFRGGGYASSNGSGAGAAAWLARHGMIGIEAEYGTRSTGATYRASYADAARAVRLVRARASEWGIDPTRVGVLGFSAGGHLASLLSTQPARPAPAEDDLARISARPDLVVLAYPLISFIDGYAPGAFAGSVESFFGEDDVDEARRRQFSNELHVEPGHPPVFLWTTADDAIVPASHAERFADACRRAHVPVAFTMYPHGPHGLGLALGQPGALGAWTTEMLRWLAARWPAR